MTEKKYNQFTAMWAITRASLTAVFRSPSAVVFSLAFPLIFIIVFGFIGGGGRMVFGVAIDKNSDTANPLFSVLKTYPGFLIEHETDAELKESLEKGQLTAVIKIDKNAAGNVPYSINIKSSEAVKPQNLEVLKSMLNSIIGTINKQTFPNSPTFATIREDIQKVPGRTYRTIDFILPGQLGFSLLSAGVFGVAFLFFNLRQQLVLKRFYATPIRRPYIILGEAIGRVIFQLSTAVVILCIGTFAFHYTLVHGFVTFLEIMVLSFIALVLFMGFGFIVSGIAKNESTIPPLANIFTLPQFLLAGTFFSIDVFPSWLQPICKVLPLTHFNNAMRQIAFEGAHLGDCLKEIGILLLWSVVVYTIAIKVFKWE